MAIINFPILYAPDPDKGRPLFNGKIFVGEPGLDPQIPANQKQLNAVQSDGTIVPVSQPFTLSAGGVPVYNGNAVRLDVDGGYSLKILDKNLVEKYFIEKVLEGQAITEVNLPSIGSDSFVRKFSTLNEAIDDANLKIGNACNIKERTAGNGGGGLWDVVLTADVTPNGFNIVQCTNIPSLSLRLQPNLDGVVRLSQWGAVSGVDQTLLGQAALDYAESIGGAVVELIAGETIISNVTSTHPNVCWLIPTNVTLRGLSYESSKITRPAAERTVNGILLANKHYDTNPNYTAAGNIVFEHFTIDDGDPLVSRSIGDLIALAHAENVTVRHCRSLNHDQHFLDIGGCKNINIYENICINDASLGSNATAIIQLDKASGMAGGYNDATDLDTINIYNNSLVQLSNSVNIQLCHGQAAGLNYKNINIINNYISIADASRDCIGLDSNNNDFRMYGLNILNNTFDCTHENARLINLFTEKPGATIKGVKIDGNTSTGQGRSFCYIGASTVATTLADISDVVISNNHGVLDATGASDCALINVHGVKQCVIANNALTAKTDTTNDLKLMFIDSCLDTIIDGNVISTDFPSNLLGGCIVLWDALSALIDMRVSITNNILNTEKIEYAIDANTLTTGVINVSANMFSDVAPTVAHIREGDVPISDGTNGWHQVDLGGTDGSLAVAASQLNTGISMGLKKAGSKPSKAKFELQYATSVAGFANDAEDLTFAVTTAGGPGYNCAGTQIADINQASGTFTILTGNLGVSFVINNTFFEAIVRPSGFIKAWCGI